MKDAFSVDFEDLVEPARLATLAASPDGRISTLSRPRAGAASASSAPAMPRAMNDDFLKKVSEQPEPTPAALEEMPEINEQRFRRRPGRGHHASRSAGEIVIIDS